MSGPGPQGQLDEATVDLLIKQVTEGLSPAEQRALDVLDGAVTSAHLKQFERAAAAISLAGDAAPIPLPADLARRLLSDAERHFTGVGGGIGVGAGTHAGAGAGSTTGTGTGTGMGAGARGGASTAAGGNVVDLAAVRSAARRAPVPADSKTGAYGWFAAAACLALAVIAWNRPPRTGVPVAAVAPNAAVAPPAAVVPPVRSSVPATAAEERAALLARSDSLKIKFGATKDPAAAGVSGDVVWDPVTQRGFMHFVGLAVNDPALRQYQLWIFDGGRDERYPVDGGVFDIPANAAEVVIPIHAALPVLSAKAFAVTIEKPGGVVVSGREHVVVLGSAG